MSNAFDLSCVVSHLPNQTLTITRTGAGSYTNGVYSGGATSSIVVQAIVWPATHKELQLLPESLRSRASLGIISKDTIRSANDPAGYQGDRFTFDGSIWEIQSVSSWSAQANFYHGIASKVVNS